MKKLTYAALALMACTSFSVAAENLQLTPVEDDYPYTATAYIEWQNNGNNGQKGNLYPNARFYAGSDNADVFTSGNVKVECTGPDGYVWTESKDFTYTNGNYQTYWGQGIVETEGEYTWTVTFTMNYAEEDKEPLVEVLKGTYEITKVVSAYPTTLTVTGADAVRTGATTGTIDVTVTPTNWVETCTKYHVWVIRTHQSQDETGGDVTIGEKDVDVTNGNPVTVAMDLSGLYEGETSNLWIKAYPIYADGHQGSTYQSNYGTIAAEPTDPDAPQPVENAFAATIEASNPVRTGATTGTVDYTFTLTQAANIKSLRVFAARFAGAGETGEQIAGEMAVEYVEGKTEYTGVLTLDNALEASQGLWVKVQATFEDDKLSAAPESMVTLPAYELAFSMTLVAESATRVSTTEAEIPFTITPVNDEKVSYYKVWAVRQNKAEDGTVLGDIEIGSMELKKGARENGVLEVSELPEGEVEVWVKAQAFDAEDTALNNEVTYPGEAQGWNGYIIPAYTNISDGVELVGAENGEAVYFNLQGVRVANPGKGLYIRVQNGKAQKVVVK